MQDRRRVFISFLGTSNYNSCTYEIGGNTPFTYESRYIQEVLLRNHAKQGWSSTDKAYILLTEVAREKNWLNDGHRTKDGDLVKQAGLRDCLAGASLPMSVEDIPVPPGNTSEEIMDIFSRVFSLINDGDELYFDITHGFRYLPMVTIVLGNYSKLLRGAKVAWIGYGNFEGRDFATNVAQVVDITSLSVLQDWTLAAADFTNNGNVEALTTLTTKEVQPILLESKGSNQTAKALRCMAKSLSEMVGDMKTCRGKEVLKSEKAGNLQCALASIEENMIPPLTPIIEKIKVSVSDFKEGYEISNGFAAAKWCMNYDMIQQAATILQETVISWIYIRNNLEGKKLEETREIVTKAIKCSELDQTEWVVKDETQRGEIKRVIENEVLLRNKAFKEIYTNLSELRNDINHCGMRNNPTSASKIKRNLERCYSKLKEIFEENF